MKPTRLFPLDVLPFFATHAPGATGFPGLRPAWPASRYAVWEQRRPVRARSHRRSWVRVDVSARWESWAYGLLAVCAVVPLVSAAVTTGGFAANFNQLIAWVRSFGL